jgi:hypothetical protein
MARSAVSTDAYAVIISTTRSWSCFLSSSSTSMPPMSGIITSTTAASNDCLRAMAMPCAPPSATVTR